MTTFSHSAALAALVAVGISIGLASPAAAVAQFQTFEVTSWTCAGNANGIWSQNCYAVADYFCKKQGYDAAVTFRFASTNGKVSRYRSIACKKR